MKNKQLTSVTVTQQGALTLSGKLSSVAFALAAVAFSPMGLAANDYATKCAMCHGPAVSSTKAGRPASATKAAIAGNVGGMGFLSTLTDAELNAIALETGGAGDLGAPAPTPAPSATPAPSTAPTPAPSTAPTPAPSASPAPTPAATPTPAPSSAPTPAPSTAPTPAPTATPSPQSPLPAAVSCDGASKNSKPIVSPISEQNATVGQELSFTVSALDCNDVPILIKASKLKGGSMPSGGQDFDGSGSWSGKYSFTPSADQANKSFTVKFTAVQTEDGRKSSRPWKVRVRVFPAGSTFDDGSVTGVKVQSARWAGNKLRVKGKVEFSKALNGGDRRLVTEGTQVSITDPSGSTEYGKYKVKSNGQWSAIIDSLTETTVPCDLAAQFNGRTDARTVKKAPATCVK